MGAPEPLAALWTRISTLAGFHAGRGGRARLAIAAGFAARAWLLVVALVSVPVTIRYLGNDGYGLLLAITSVVTWLQLTSFGIGAGLQNALAEEVGKDNCQAQQALVTTAVVSLLFLGSIIFIGAAGLAFVLDWARLFPTASARFDAELHLAAILAVFAFCCALAFSFVPAILNARQESHLAYAQQVVAGTAALAALFIASRADWGLAGIVMALNVVPALVACGAGVWLVYWRGIPHLRPAAGHFSGACLRRLANRSSWFVVLTLTNIAFFQSDIFILARTQGAEAAAPFGVAQRAYAQLGTLFAIVTGSLWVAYGNAKAQGDVAWIERTYARVRHVQALTFGAALAFMLTAGEPLLRLWVGPDAAPSWQLVAACAALFVAQQWTATHALMLNGLDIVSPQVPCLLLNGMLVIAFSFIGARSHGAIGLALGCVLAYAATSAWYLPLLVRRAIGRMKPSPAGVAGAG